MVKSQKADPGAPEQARVQKDQVMFKLKCVSTSEQAKKWYLTLHSLETLAKISASEPVPVIKPVSWLECNALLKIKLFPSEASLCP